VKFFSVLSSAESSDQSSSKKNLIKTVCEKRSNEFVLRFANIETTSNLEVANVLEKEQKKRRKGN